MKTQEEVYFSKGPDVGNFRIFRSSIYFHVTKDARKKLEPTTKLGIFLGYNDTLHNYRVYFLTNMVTTVDRDVRFDEGRTFRRSQKRVLQG